MTSLDKTYERYLTGESSTCGVSIDDLGEADRLVDTVLKAFGMNTDLTGLDVMDLGCGLGCVAEALQTRGARVRALDNSSQAIEHIERTYPRVDAECAAFGPDYVGDRHYDVIWMRDFSLCSTLDCSELENDVLDPCLRLLKPGGCILMGYRSAFTGKIDDGNWANWRYSVVQRLRRNYVVEGPRIVQFRNALISRATLQAARFMRRRVPFYMRITARRPS
jgi:SAM-dependent methyltransferase